MGVSVSILTSAEELEDLRQTIRSFAKAYGECYAKVYAADSVIEEEGMVIHGEYGVLDSLLAPLVSEKIVHSLNTEDARMLLKWDLVIFTPEGD